MTLRFVNRGFEVIGGKIYLNLKLVYEPQDSNAEWLRVFRDMTFMAGVVNPDPYIMDQVLHVLTRINGEQKTCYYVDYDESGASRRHWIRK